MGLNKRAIREVHSAWIAAVNAGDLPRLLTLMADDAVFLNPGQAPVGRDGFAANFKAAPRAKQFAGYRITIYREQSDGRWVLARDAHTLSPVES